MGRTPSKMNVNDMYSTLPKSLTMELAVKTKINDPSVVEERRKLTAEHTPMELGNIGSLADLPIPTPISNLFNKPAADTPEKPKRKKNMEEKRKRNLTTGTFLSSDFLPQSWLDTKLVCRTKVEEDPEILAKRQEMVAGKSVSELSKMSGLDDFPLPTRVETLVRKKRVLKSTDEKENVKKGVSRSVTSLSAKSVTSLSIPESLLTPLAVKSVVEDQDLVAKNKEIIKTKSVGELAHIGTLSDFPIPDNVENLYNKLTATSTKRPAPAAPTERPSSPQSFKETIYETLPRSMRKTLVDSANRPHSSLSADVTLADSCVDSLVSCAETLVGDSDPNLETCAETLRDEDQTEFFSDDDLDNPYPAVDFDQMMAQGPGAGAQIVDRPGRSSVKKSESGRRLQEGTEQLSMELMEHVESLKTTLDNMSSRLGTQSRSRSHSKSRHSSQYRPSEQ